MDAFTAGSGDVARENQLLESVEDNRAKLAGRLAEEGGDSDASDDESDGDEPLDVAAEAPAAVVDLTVEKFCFHCGRKFPKDGDNFCGECGKERRELE